MEGILKNKKRKNKENENEKSKKKSQREMASLSCGSPEASYDSPQAESKFDVDLSEEGNFSSAMPEFTIHLGRGYILTIKEYQSSKYICFSRETNGRITNRFNLPAPLKDNLKEAIKLATDHASKYT
ncbi:hypothetical protein AVEN_167353-1 [Araneus ventricosus]|uniref:Uncharacterized protein n=1 Tax=Araneus ventricosus TaxID=182803 RepID=A0A4Y2QIE1_ARAVE|nr:hypothetical protein AVEN_167353-1 [Araneus ventricosus]